MGLGLTEMLLGQDPLDVEGLWERLYVGSAMNGRRGAAVNAIGALDIALHDLRGKALGKPCCDLLGGKEREGVTPYASLQPEVSSFVYLADKGFSSVAWERHWLEEYGALVAATPQRTSRKAWPEAACRWAAGKRQLIEGVMGQLKDLLGLERHRAKRWAGSSPASRRRSRPTPAAGC